MYVSQGISEFNSGLYSNIAFTALIVKNHLGLIISEETPIFFQAVAFSRDIYENFHTL